MDQPLYIAPDEEIISVIARLRALPDSAVTLVFPKHSVVTQSIINLKLLAREGEKLQKSLTLVSQNENARSLAEKIGFTTLPYTQEMEKGNLFIPSSEEGVAPEVITAPVKPELKIFEEPESDMRRPKSADIGTQGFYTTPSQTASETKKMGDIKPQITSDTPLPSQPTSLRVRNMSPERLPSLNSLRTAPETVPGDISINSTVSTPTFPDGHVEGQNDMASQWPESGTPTAIKQFFNRTEPAQETPIRMPLAKQSRIEQPAFIKKEELPTKKAKPVLVGKGVSSKLKWFLLGFILLFAIALIALLFFLVFPRASVSVTPQTLQESYDQSFTIDATGAGGEIPLNKSTREVTAKVAGIASGASGSATSTGSRAKGTLKITNSYSSEAQTLVASTRFESKDGKIYRIQEGVTVPGNGSVEAQVIADGSGASYNMNEGSFTIPGFKESDKYEKFGATLVGTMSGGEGNETASGGTFIRADEETLRSRALDEAKRIFTEELTEEGDTYTFTDGLIAERVTETNLPKVGSVPGEYEYSAVFKVTAFTTSKEAVTKAVLKSIRTEYDGITFAPTQQELSFADFALNEKGDQASLKAHLETTLAANINEEKIKADLAGKSSAQLEDFTTTHPEVMGLSIDFQPSWALKRIPNNTDKINLVIEL